MALKKPAKAPRLTNLKILELARERGYFVSKVPKSRSGLKFKTDLKRWNGDTYKFAVISCTHLGSKYQQLTALNSFYSLCARSGITTVFHCGDIVDGEHMWRGHEYDIFALGADAQIKYAVKSYPKIRGMQTKIISGNHDLSFWNRSGINVVESICRQRPDFEYLGDNYALGSVAGMKIGLMHAMGGVPYARSYKPQKIVEQLAPEQKPNLLFIGHWHVPVIVPAYRNVEVVSLGCFQAQTPFLTRLGLQPVVSGLIVEFKKDSRGLASVKYQWIPFYKRIKNDY